MDKHTPGPWRYDNSVMGRVFQDTSSTGPGYSGAKMICHGIARQDARLITAAPDLLAACKAALRVLESEPECAIYKAHTGIVRAAIAKTEGDQS